MVKIIGERAKLLDAGAEPHVLVEEGSDALTIARLEFCEKVIPTVILIGGVWTDVCDLISPDNIEFANKNWKNNMLDRKLGLGALSKVNVQGRVMFF